MASYTIKVKTGTRNKSGTDARVFIQLIGARRTSGEHELKSSSPRLFEKGSLDTFKLTTDDVGWIEAVRVFHNNAKKRPGWFLEWIEVTSDDFALTFRAEFNRWLARDVGDGSIDATQSIPITSVSVARGDVVSYYMGYNVSRRANGTGTVFSYADTFSFQHRQGLTLKAGLAVSASTGGKLSAGFLGGTKGELSVDISRTVSTEIGSTQEQVITATSQYQYSLDPGKSATVVALYYQNVLEGSVNVLGVKVPFEDRFVIDQDLIAFEGLLADGDVTNELQKILSAIAGTQVSANEILSGKSIVLGKTNLAGVAEADLSARLQSIPMRWLKPHHIGGAARVIPSSASEFFVPAPVHRLVD